MKGLFYDLHKLMHIKGDSVDQYSTIYWIYIIMVVIEQNLRFWISTGTYLPV